MATIKKVKEGQKFMAGTTGNPYFPFARKGNVLLGVRLQSAAPGDCFGVKNTTYFTLRLRSAPEAGLFADDDAKKTVVKLQKNPDNLWDAWAGIEWEKKSPERASTTIGVFERGHFQAKDPDLLNELLGHIGDGKLAEKFTEHLVELAGQANLICRRSELRAFLDEAFAPVIDKLVDHAKKQEAFVKDINDNIGTVQMHAKLIKKTFGSPSPDAHEEAEVADIEGDQE